MQPAKPQQQQPGMYGAAMPAAMGGDAGVDEEDSFWGDLQRVGVCDVWSLALRSGVWSCMALGKVSVCVAFSMYQRHMWSVRLHRIVMLLSFRSLASLSMITFTCSSVV